VSSLRATSAPRSLTASTGAKHVLERSHSGNVVYSDHTDIVKEPIARVTSWVIPSPPLSSHRSSRPLGNRPDRQAR
jgi:hypothetical protein